MKAKPFFRYDTTPKILRQKTWLGMHTTIPILESGSAKVLRFRWDSLHCQLCCNISRSTFTCLLPLCQYCLLSMMSPLKIDSIIKFSAPWLGVSGAFCKQTIQGLESYRVEYRICGWRNSEGIRVHRWCRWLIKCTAKRRVCRACVAFVDCRPRISE